MTARTYSLEEAAGIICGRTDSGDVVPGGQQWLALRLRGAAKPSLEGLGFKVARGKWRMTAEQVDQALQVLTPKQVPVPVMPAPTSMTPTSRRRLAS